MLIDKMDPKGYILYRLYQGHMRYHKGERVKVRHICLSEEGRTK